MNIVIAAFAPGVGCVKVDWVETARFADGSEHLLQTMEPLTLEPMAPSTQRTLVLDATKTFQEIVGFGGAFTEAAAIRWRQLTPADQAKVIQLYFANPSNGGHGYTLGRVPINSCDFSPASYSFDNKTGDMELSSFDDSVAHDVDVGMIPMIQAAQRALASHGAKLRLFASPWSPPAWMKNPVAGKQSMTLSATPNGLMSSMRTSWAKYFSRFISAYKAHGIDMWAVTVQNEPEAAVGWEACLWTPDFMAEFVASYLGPVLAEEQPGVKIIGFDHNKDHVATWAKVMYSNLKAKEYLAGIGVHWYGGLNVNNLNDTHNMAPDKFILGTEACNCGGVVYKDPDRAEWWARAESLALDILEDLRFWAVGWTDWNLVLGTDGGPNHLKNLCDANIITDPSESLGMGTLIMQASYYYMGHFSRFIPPGSKRISVTNHVETKVPPLTADDVKNGQPLVFLPCDGNDVQSWSLDETGSLIVTGTESAEGSDGYQVGGECADADLDGWLPKIQVWKCAHSGNQNWVVGASSDAGHQLKNTWTGKCMTAVLTSGSAVGLDAGVKVMAAQLLDCLPPGTANQTFRLSNFDGGGFPDNFPVRTAKGLCLQPQITRLPHFDVVAFLTPDNYISLIGINLGEKPIDFSIYDAIASVGSKTLWLPAHAIQSYQWPASVSTKPAKAQLSTHLTSEMPSSAADVPPVQSLLMNGVEKSRIAGPLPEDGETSLASPFTVLLAIGIAAGFLFVGAVELRKWEAGQQWRSMLFAADENDELSYSEFPAAEGLTEFSAGEGLKE